MLETLPIIAVARCLGSDPEGRAAEIAKLRLACEETGFFLVSEHGVPESVIQHAYDETRSFFDQSEDVKNSVPRPEPGISRGYNRLSDQSLAYSFGQVAPPDLQESFAFGPLSVPAGLPAEAAPHYAENLWPTAVPTLRPALEAYYKAMEGLASRIMRAMALALDLPETFFDDKIDRHITVSRVINYPDQKDEPLPGQLRAGAHSDWGSITILRIEDAPGGLQIRRPDGSWLGVAPVAGTFVVNIGDLMMRWTNDRWRSTVHRVVNPARDQALGSRRISMVFFHQPNYDAEIACLETCLAPGEQPKYPPVRSGPYYRMKLLAAREMKDVAA